MKAESPFLRAPSPAFLFGAIAALTAVRLMMGLSFDLFQDEAFYAWIALRAPLNFSPHPPGGPFLFRTGMAIFGKNEMGMRFFSFLLMTLSFVPIWLLARRLYGKAVAGWTVIAVASVPIYMAFGGLATPDGAQLFVWTLALYFAWRALESDRMVWWVAVGVTVGLGLFIKYILVLFYPSLFLCLLLPSPFRRRLRSPGLYVAQVISALVFVPLAAWQGHLDGWSALRYHLSQRQSFIEFSPLSEGVYQGVHLGYYSPLLYVGSVIAMVWACKNGIQRRDPRLVFLFSFSAVVYVFFAVIVAFTVRDLSREQWDAMVYVPGLIAAIVMVNETADRSVWIPRLARIAPAIGAVTVGVFAVESCIGGLSRMIGRPPGAALMGWREMASAVDKELETMENGNPEFVLTSSFVPAVQYAFYGKATDRVYALDNNDSVRFGLNEVFHRYGMSQDELASATGLNSVFVVEEYPNSKKQFISQTERREEKLKRLYTRIEELPPQYITRFGQVIKRFRLYKCFGLREKKE